MYITVAQLIEKLIEKVNQNPDLKSAMVYTLGINFTTNEPMYFQLSKEDINYVQNLDMELPFDVSTQEKDGLVIGFVPLV